MNEHKSTIFFVLPSTKKSRLLLYANIRTATHPAGIAAFEFFSEFYSGMIRFLFKIVQLIVKSK